VHKIILRLIGVVMGAIIFRLILAIALSIGIDPILLKLITAGIVLVVVALPSLKKTDD
jgi:putative tryptophan/tyrosine transport system permease protein